MVVRPSLKNKYIEILIVNKKRLVFLTEFELVRYEDHVVKSSYL